MRNVNCRVAILVWLFFPFVSFCADKPRVVLAFSGVGEHACLSDQSSVTGEQELVFRPVISGRKLRKDGGGISTAAFKSQDGVIVESNRSSFSSDAKAKKAMRELVSRASGVIEEGDKLDLRGQKVGQRAILCVHRGKIKEFYIVWTEGRVLQYVVSISLRHAIAFEKRGNP